MAEGDMDAGNILNKISPVYGQMEQLSKAMEPFYAAKAQQEVANQEKLTRQKAEQQQKETNIQESFQALSRKVQDIAVKEPQVALFKVAGEERWVHFSREGRSLRVVLLNAQVKNWGYFDRNKIEAHFAVGLDDQGVPEEYQVLDLEAIRRSSASDAQLGNYRTVLYPPSLTVKEPNRSARFMTPDDAMGLTAKLEPLLDVFGGEASNLFPPTYYPKK